MAENKEKRKKKRKKHRLFWFFVKMQVLLMLIVLGCLGYYYYGGYAREIQELRIKAVRTVADMDENIFYPSEASTIYDRDGNLLMELKRGQQAEYVEYKDIPTSFVNAMISIEDKKFYTHNGVDYKAAFRALKSLIKNRRITQGGSTITMQLAKLTFMQSNRSWQYKVEQMFLAMELEKKYSKNKIMEFYLNNIYFANGYNGIQAACRGYFNCTLQELDLSQIAFLCAIPNSPTYYDPVVNMEHTIKRRDLILRNMRDDGKIDQMTYNRAVEEIIVLERPTPTQQTLKHNYVDTFVMNCVTKALMHNQGFIFQYYFDSPEEQKEYEQEYDELYAECQQKMYTQGYEIYTSIDLEKQERLQNSIDSELESFTDVSEEGVYKMQGSAVCIDNDSGLVVAIVGGRSQEFKNYTLNRAYQSYRQPGSSIKPLIVYTPMFERGMDPNTIVNDYQFEEGPSNASDVYYGEVPVRFAIQKSLNTVAWQLYEQLSPQVGLQYLKAMNFQNIVEEDYIAATSLGGFTKGTSALEMASAYATIVNDGNYREPTCVRTILDKDGNILYVPEQKETSIYSETAARMMTDCMKTVMEEGTGRSVQLSNMPCAGKTGTTNDHKDGWFVGFTRYYTTSVWVGYDMPKAIDGLSGSTYPGRIWNTYMEDIHEGLMELNFLPYAQISEDYDKYYPEESEELSEELLEEELPEEELPEEELPQEELPEEELPQEELPEELPQEEPPVSGENQPEDTLGGGTITEPPQEELPEETPPQEEPPQEELPEETPPPEEPPQEELPSEELPQEPPQEELPQEPVQQESLTEETPPPEESQ